MKSKGWLVLIIPAVSQQGNGFSVQAFQSASSRVLSVGSVNRCTILQAFGLPDELPPQNEGSEVAEATLSSLQEKLEKSKEQSEKPKKKDNKAMAFLKKVGKVGGASNKNFVNAVGSDEGSTGRQPPVQRDDMSEVKKSRVAYQECTISGVVDDMSEAFPLTSSGTEWRGISDRVMGGRSDGFIKREVDLEGRSANVLTGRVSLANNGGFLQMVTDLDLDPSKNSVDASEYDGFELNVLYRGDEQPGKAQTFNVHLRTPGTYQQASYRHTFEMSEPNKWEKIMIPFSSFEGYQVAEPLDTSALRRIGIVAIGKEMDVFLALGGISFYSVF